MPSPLAAQTVEKALAIQAQVVDRRASGKTVGTEVKTELAILHFLPEGPHEA